MGTLAAYAMVGSSKLAIAAVSKDGKVEAGAEVPPGARSACEAVQHCGGAAGWGDCGV